MNFEIVKLQEFSGAKATIYSILPEGSDETLFETFIRENVNSHAADVNDIIERLSVIGNDTGAREQYFKLNEGKPGDGVCALYDEPERHLRVYCIRNGSCVVILGGGGLKEVRAVQDSPKLTEENYKVREVSARMMERIISGELYWEREDLAGDFKFYDNE